MRTQVRSLASLSGLRIQHCCELWYGLQRQLGSGVAVALAWAGSYSSDLTPSLGTSIYRVCSHPPLPLKKKKEKEMQDECVLEIYYTTSCLWLTALHGTLKNLLRVDLMLHVIIIKN